jgi:hypothetical protein
MEGSIKRVEHPNLIDDDMPRVPNKRSWLFVFKENITMKKTIVSIMAISAISLGACNSGSNPTPTPVPSESVVVSESPTAVATPEPEVTTKKPDPARTTDKPETKDPVTAEPTTTGAVPPAIEFAQRWGAKYPNVPEFAILKAANATCDAIATAGTDYANNTVTMGIISSVVSTAGLSENDALEFAQDADQNYCSSRP